MPNNQAYFWNKTIFKTMFILQQFMHPTEKTCELLDSPNKALTFNMPCCHGLSPAMVTLSTGIDGILKDNPCCISCE
jgi:hypothetical protein